MFPFRGSKTQSQTHDLIFAMKLSTSLKLTLFWMTVLSTVSAMNSVAADLHVLAFFNRLQPAEVHLNGFPVHTSAGTNQHTSSFAADSYLVRGTNVLTMVTSDSVTNLPLDEFAMEQASLEFAEKELGERIPLFVLERQLRPDGTNALREAIRYNNVSGVDLGFSAGVSNSRTHLTIDGEAGQGRYETFRIRDTNVIELRVVLTNPPLTSLPWQGNVPNINSSDLAQIRAVVGTLHAALADRNVSTLTNLLRAKIERSAIVKGVTFNEEATLRSLLFQRLFSLPGFTLAPLNVASIAVKQSPSANLAQALIDGKEPIFATGEGFRYRLAVFLSKIGGTWQIVD